MKGSSALNGRERSIPPSPYPRLSRRTNRRPIEPHSRYGSFDVQESLWPCLKFYMIALSSCPQCRRCINWPAWRLDRSVLHKTCPSGHRNPEKRQTGPSDKVQFQPWWYAGGKRNLSSQNWPMAAPAHKPWPA